MKNVKDTWKTALPEESDFWRNWFKTKGMGYPDYGWRLDPEYEFQPDLRPYAPASGVVRVLDVGAGPLTVLGKQWKGRTLDLHAVDPLADEYDTLLDEFNITPIVRTELCDGERLTEKYNESTFDIVYACNCLDHSYSPLDCFKQMVKVVKPGGYVITDHLVNEGKHQGYKDIHQWNFCTRKSLFGKPERFYIRRPGCMIDLQKALRDTARVTAKTVPGSAQYPAPHVMTWIKKL